MNAEPVSVASVDGSWTQPYEIGNLSERFFAFVLDKLLVGALFLIVALIIVFGKRISVFSVFSENTPIALLIVIDAIYHLFFWTRPRGQTMGKRYVNNRVIKVDGGRLTLKDAFIRYVFSYANTLLLAVGWIALIFNYEHRGWHDRAAGTVVVLYEPSATADTAPFRPRTIALGCLVFGIPVAAMMAAVNWRRLGRPERYRPTLVRGFVLALAVYVIGSHPVLYQLLPEPIQIIGIASIVMGIPIIYSLIVIRSQSADYRTWYEHNGGKHSTRHQSGRKTFSRILLAWLGLLVVYGWLLIPLAVGLTVPLLPDRQFTDQTINFVYPGGWNISTEFDGQPFCQQSGVTCLIAGTDRVQAIIHFDFQVVNGIDSPDSPKELRFELERFNGLDVALRSAEQVDEQVWTAIREQDPTTTLIDHNVRQINGRTAVERRFSRGANTAMYIYIKNQLGIYRFYAEAANDIFRQRQSALDKLIASIKFVA